VKKEKEQKKENCVENKELWMKGEKRFGMEVGGSEIGTPKRPIFPPLMHSLLLQAPELFYTTPLGSSSHSTLYEGRRHPLFNYALIRVKYKLAT
jgi:hypothetical protein